MKKGILSIIILLFSYFSYAQPLNPANFVLPVKLVSFKAVATNGTASIYWETAQEMNSNIFEVQHSVNGTHWTKIGIVKAAGSSAVPQKYTYVHSQPAQGQNFYRLKSIDLDQSAEFSHTVLVTFDFAASIRIYPVPVQDQFTVEIDAIKDPFSYTIVNAEGREVKRGTITQTKQRIPVADLGPGLYYFKTSLFAPVKFVK